MIDLKPYLELSKEISTDIVPTSFHPSFYPSYEKLKKWLKRFPHTADETIFNDLLILYLLASKKYLDHRSSTHLFRIALSVHLMQKELLRSSTFLPHQRHLEIRWLPTALTFPFSSKKVLGCLIGFNVMDRYEVFDEENILLALQKNIPQLRLVKESAYCHNSQHKNLKIFYLEIEKKNATAFSLVDRKLLQNNLKDKVKNSIQMLSPTIFMGHNEEEIYKNILVLSQEIRSLQDLPQAYITLNQQTGKEIVFRVTLVYISPFHRLSLKERFFNSLFVSERVATVRSIENRPIEAHIFNLHLPREPALLRSDGSLDFYAARQKVTSLMKAAIGEFRDYNGGIIIKQQELLLEFKERFPAIAEKDPELMEGFFYALNPLEKQAVLNQDTLADLFGYYLEERKVKLPKDSYYSLKIEENCGKKFIIVHGESSLVNQTITNILQEQPLRNLDIAYNILDTAEGVFFNCVVLQEDAKGADYFIQALRQTLHHWQKKMKERQVLKIGLEYSLVSLDPRIGGEVVSGDILRLLFEGLTRFNQNGHIENGVAESITVSSDGKDYLFKLRPSLWNDGSPVSAYDFEYAWKKILSPDFKTAFAYLFYPIKNAKEAKEGKVAADQVGIHVVDDRTLKIELKYPTPYFLQSLANPLYSPVHRLIDQHHPEWPYQSEKNYPCNGPFQIKINQPNQGYQLVKNPFYWDASHISLDQIILTMMHPSQGIQAFQRKEIDWVGNPFGGFYSSYSEGKDSRIISLPNSWVCWCVFNTMHPPFNHPKLRQAFAYAIHRAKLVTNAFIPLNPAFSPLLPHYSDNHYTLFPDWNPEKARAVH